MQPETGNIDIPLIPDKMTFTIRIQCTLYVVSIQYVYTVDTYIMYLCELDRWRIKTCSFIINAILIHC